MKTILVVNAKGGCGKTTISTNLASYFATNELNTVLVDFDPQQSALEWLKERNEDYYYEIQGISPFENRLRFSADVDRVVLDAPARVEGKQLADLVTEDAVPATARRALPLVRRRLGLGDESPMSPKLARELAKYGVTVNAIAPRARTRMTQSVLGDLAPAGDIRPIMDSVREKAAGAGAGTRTGVGAGVGSGVGVGAGGRV